MNNDIVRIFQILVKMLSQFKFKYLSESLKYLAKNIFTKKNNIVQNNFLTPESTLPKVSPSDSLAWTLRFANLTCGHSAVGLILIFQVLMYLTFDSCQVVLMKVVIIMRALGSILCWGLGQQFFTVYYCIFYTVFFPRLRSCVLSYRIRVFFFRNKNNLNTRR